LSTLFFEHGIRVTIRYLLQCFKTATLTSTSTVSPTTAPRTATSTPSTSVKPAGMTVETVILLV